MKEKSIVFEWVILGKQSISKNKTDRRFFVGGDRSMEEIEGMGSLAIGSIELSVGCLPLPSVLFFLSVA